MSDRILRVNASGELESLQIPVVSGGASDSGKAVGIDVNGKIDISFMPTGIGVDSVTVVASEALSAGDFVNLYDNAGTVSARKADNTTNTKPANGFVKVSVASGSNAVVYTEGDNDVLTGLAVGTKYFLGTTGGKTSTIPTASGTIIQNLGVVKSPTTLRFEQKDYIKNV
jgi:hypothetical protein